jgi:hypothetical protein
MDAQDRIIYAQTGGGKRIGTAFDRIGALRGGGLRLAMWQEQQARGIGFPFDARPQGRVKAEVNHGRWIARCVVCGGAEEVTPKEPVFYCLSCGNADNGGHVMAVVFPDDREAIEAELLRRPDIGTRNWLPTETVNDLASESAAHGV